MKTILETMRPSAGMIEELRAVIRRSPDLTLDELIAAVHSQTSPRTSFVVQLGWALAELAAVEDAERLPGSPFGKQLRQALADAPDFEPGPLRYVPEIPPAQFTEAPVLAFWREAYLAALGALLDPTLHFSDAGQGISAVAASIADRAAMHFEELRTTRLAELIEYARPIAERFRKDPRQ